MNGRQLFDDIHGIRKVTIRVYEQPDLYNADCMEAMKQFKDKFFDLAIVDPPYGIGENGTSNHTRSCLAVSKDYESFHGEDREPPNEAYFAELFRVSKNQIVFGANHFISRLPIDSSCWIVWDKDNGENDFADCELAWTSFKTAVRRYRFRWQGMLQGNMKEKEDRIHPTQKPVSLYQWILNKYAKKGDKILDTHAGSASSLIACHRAGLDGWGFEIDELYYKRAKLRLDRERDQVSIFELIRGEQDG